MAKKTVESSGVVLDEVEKHFIIKGLDKLLIEAEKLSLSAQRMDIIKASREVSAFKLEIEAIKNKIKGQQALI